MFPDTLLEPYMAKAQVRIDSKLSKRYQVPLADPVPDIVKSILIEMATGFVLIGETASRASQEMLNLGNGKIKRAETDLEEVVREGLIDTWPGVILAVTPGSDSTPAVSSTTPGPSPLGGALDW